MNKYDYVIVGAGPTGLTLAYYLGKLNKKCLLIDKNESIGGCHRVIRVNGLMTEHSPRIYSDSYVNFIELLKKMDVNFYDLFTKYNFTQIQSLSANNFTITGTLGNQNLTLNVTVNNELTTQTSAECGQQGTTVQRMFD